MIKVHISRKDWDKLQLYIELSDLEITIFGRTKMMPCEGSNGSNSIIIEELLPIPKQKVTGVTTHIDVNDMAEFVREHFPKLEDRAGFGFYAHSHVDMNAFWSKTDEDNIDTWTASNHLISLVMNRKGEYKIRYDTYMPFRTTCEDVDLYVVDPLDEAARAEVSKEIKDKCISPSILNHGHNYRRGGYGGYYSNDDYMEDASLFGGYNDLYQGKEWDQSKGRWVLTDKVGHEIDSRKGKLSNKKEKGRNHATTKDKERKGEGNAKSAKDEHRDSSLEGRSGSVECSPSNVPTTSQEQPEGSKSAEGAKGNWVKRGSTKYTPKNLYTVKEYLGILCEKCSSFVMHEDVVGGKLRETLEECVLEPQDVVDLIPEGMFHPTSKEEGLSSLLDLLEVIEKSQSKELEDLVSELESYLIYKIPEYITLNEYIILSTIGAICDENGVEEASYRLLVPAGHNGDTMESIRDIDQDVVDLMLMDEFDTDVFGDPLLWINDLSELEDYLDIEEFALSKYIDVNTVRQEIISLKR